MDNTLKKMDLNFTGSAKHKISIENFLQTTASIFLDVRSKEEVDVIKFNFKIFNIEVINIPIEELPNKYNMLPKDKLIGTFCSSKTRSSWAYIYLISKGYEKTKWIAAGYEDIVANLKPGAILKNLKK